MRTLAKGLLWRNRLIGHSEIFSRVADMVNQQLPAPGLVNTYVAAFLVAALYVVLARFRPRRSAFLRSESNALLRAERPAS